MDLLAYGPACPWTWFPWTCIYLDLPERLMDLHWLKHAASPGSQPTKSIPASFKTGKHAAARPAEDILSIDNIGT